jgi:hypothetical protein
LSCDSELWQSIGMGNKDARKREVKKPKKKKVKVDPSQMAAIVKKVPWTPQGQA